MRCPACGNENREGAKFCRGCGASFSSSCPKCGAKLCQEDRFCDSCGQRLGQQTPAAVEPPDPRSYTPKHLAEKILTSRSALEGERKQVTILFADVRGSTELASELDPEEWHGIMDRFFQILAEGVHRFEGTINQYTGDGIMALFGAPIAHEDHARRACYTALYLRDELRRYADELRCKSALNFSVRMGMNSARWWSAESATICGWTTRRKATQSVSPRPPSRVRWVVACRIDGLRSLREARAAQGGKEK